jgi:hypothetical protein
METLPAVRMPKIFEPKPIQVWIVIGLFCVYLLVSWGIFFEAVTPVADFRFQPTIEADSSTYWIAAGLHTTDFSEQAPGTDAAGNLFGPVIQAALLRTNFNVALCNCLLLIASLWVVGSMPEFDRSMFLLLMMANPLLISSLITLNKEIFAMAGMIFFIRYTSVKRFRLFFLFLALSVSFMARWQQTFVMLLFVGVESHLSPVRRHPRLAILTTLGAFTMGYALVVRLVPSFFEALLAQAQAGHTIVLLDNIQARYGFPVVVIPKILMNVSGHFITPGYFLANYWTEDFANWRDQIFTVIHTLMTTFLLLILFFTNRLRTQYAAVRLLAYYLMMTAINPMIQPRYEYAAYVLLCLEASRYFRLNKPEAHLAPVGVETSPVKELRSAPIF